MIDSAKNFVKGYVSTGYDEAAVGILLRGGQGDVFADPAIDGAYNATYWNVTDFSDPSDDPKKEIIRIVGKFHDTLTVERDQEGTGATVKNIAGKEYMIAVGITAKTISDIKEEIALIHTELEDLDIEFQKTSTKIQFRFSGGAWVDLITIAEMKGAQGDTGATGSAGQDGNDGINGIDGNDGSNGADGQNGADGLQIELRKSSVYLQWRYVGGSWGNLILLADLKGADGAKGAKGNDGADGANGFDGREIELQKGTSTIQWRYSGGYWADLVDLEDLRGADGTPPTSETFLPSALALVAGTHNSGSLDSILTFNDGNVYNIQELSATPGFDIRVSFADITEFNKIQLNLAYSNTSQHFVTVDLYNFITSAWDTIGYFRGLNGMTQFNLGIIDDAPYLNAGVVELRIYHVSAGVTAHSIQLDFASIQKSLQGGQGPQGLPGTNGTNSSWINGIGAPSNGVGNNGDYAIATDTFNVYTKIAGVWTLIANIKGANGSNGANGTNGTNGSNGADGADGSDGREIELQKTATKIQWRYVGGGSWIDLVLLSDIKGNDGATGATGANGADGNDGADGATGATGAKGDKGDPASFDVITFDADTYAVVATIGEILINCIHANDMIITLPTAVGNEAKIFIKNKSQFKVTIDPMGAELINDSSTLIIQYHNSSLTLVSDGASWCII
jgi:hypothetical protein